MKIRFPEKIHNDSKGFVFLNSLSNYQKTEDLIFDMEELKFIEAGTLPHFAIIIEYCLRKHKNVTYMNLNEELKKFFQKNNFSKKMTIKNDGESRDLYNSMMKYTEVTDINEFIKYIENEVFKNKIDKYVPINEEKRKEIIENIAELFINAEQHALSEKVMICGQIYPKTKELVLSVANAGKTFIETIRTIELYKEYSAIECVRVSLEKFVTSKKDSPGGLGLNRIVEFLKEHRGSLKIITGEVYYSENFFNNSVEKEELKSKFSGSTVTLVFKIDQEEKIWKNIK